MNNLSTGSMPAYSQLQYKKTTSEKRSLDQENIYLSGEEDFKRSEFYKKARIDYTNTLKSARDSLFNTNELVDKITGVIGNSSLKEFVSMRLVCKNWEKIINNNLNVKWKKIKANPKLHSKIKSVMSDIDKTKSDFTILEKFYCLSQAFRSIHWSHAGRATFIEENIVPFSINLAIIPLTTTAINQCGKDRSLLQMWRSLLFSVAEEEKQTEGLWVNAQWVRQEMKRELIAKDCLEVQMLQTEGLTNLPDEVLYLKNLESLQLEKSNLEKYPLEIGSFQQLTSLSLKDSQLSELSPEINKLASLTWLNLSCNKLKALPVEISELKNLQYLYLNGNQLEMLPTEISSCASLKVIDLADNKFSTFPSALCRIVSLEKISFKKNQLTELPKEISNLGSLKFISLSENQFSEFPNVIYTLRSLRKIYLKSNKINQFPAKEDIKRINPNLSVSA